MSGRKRPFVPEEKKDQDGEGKDNSECSVPKDNEEKPPAAKVAKVNGVERLRFLSRTRTLGITIRRDSAQSRIMEIEIPTRMNIRRNPVGNRNEGDIQIENQMGMIRRDESQADEEKDKKKITEEIKQEKEQGMKPVIEEEIKEETTEVTSQLPASGMSIIEQGAVSSTTSDQVGTLHMTEQEAIAQVSTQQRGATFEDFAMEHEDDDYDGVFAGGSKSGDSDEDEDEEEDEEEEEEEEEESSSEENESDNDDNNNNDGGGGDSGAGAGSAVSVASTGCGEENTTDQKTQQPERSHPPNVRVYSAAQEDPNMENIRRAEAEKEDEEAVLYLLHSEMDKNSTDASGLPSSSDYDMNAPPFPDRENRFSASADVQEQPSAPLPASFEGMVSPAADKMLSSAKK